MTAKKKRLAAVQEIPSPSPIVVAIPAACLWTWAVALLATRHHLVCTYGVVPAAPWLWGPVALPVPLLVLILVLGLLMTLLCLRYARARRDLFAPALTWLLISAFVPALDLLRLLGIPVPLTFIEPLVLTAITSLAVGEMAAALPIPALVQRRLASVPWLVVLWVATILFGTWCYLQSVHAYDNFMLGFNDFGHFGQRVANTWAGRGFLMETPSLPPFWDHFNPGLALLAPLWGLWPDPKLFMVIQALCLSLSAPILYGIARQLRATDMEAAIWATAYLLYPPLNQLNLNFSYGWHPVSLALPLLLLTFLFLLKGQHIAAFLAALLACSFREDVLVILGCLAAAMALQLGWARWRARPSEPPVLETGVLADRLPIRSWLTINVVLVVAFVFIYEFSGFRQFQVSRFDRLGDSSLAIVLSPVLRPGAFWGTVLRWSSAYFLLALLVPLGLRSLYRGRWILLTCALPVAVLLAWGHQPAITIAFQYTTTFIPILFLAALAGAAARGDQAGADTATSPMWPATVTAWVGCAVASLWLSTLPWCENTLTDMLGRTYASESFDKFDDRLPGKEGIKVLHEVVALVEEQGATSVLATGRLASHFMGIERLDTVGQAPQRWPAFEAEAGPGRSAIELFDWIVVDTYELFQQTGEDITFILEEARGADYCPVVERRGVMVLVRPDK